MGPLASVVIPTRNRAALLDRTLATVLAQRLANIEVIVVDDGSEDGTADLLRSVGDERLRTVRHAEGRGVATARNTGIEAAGAPWVAFLDDDDLWAPHKLARQVDELVACPGTRWVVDGAVVVDGQLRIVGAQPPPAGPDLAAALLAANVVPGGASGVVAERDLVLEVGGFDPALSLLADWDLWIRLALAAPAAIVDEPLHAYHLHGASMSSQDRSGEAELGLVEAKYAGVRAERGVALAADAFAFWLADCRQRAHRRLAAADGYLHSAGHTGAVSAGLHAAAALVWPGSIRHLNAWRAARVDRRWAAEAEAWLGPVRSPAVPPVAGTGAPRPRRRAAS